MISLQSELASEEIHVKFGDPKNNGKTLLLDLTVVFFSDDFKDLEAYAIRRSSPLGKR